MTLSLSGGLATKVMARSREETTPSRLEEMIQPGRKRRSKMRTKKQINKEMTENLGVLKSALVKLRRILELAELAVVDGDFDGIVLGPLASDAQGAIERLRQLQQESIEWDRQKMGGS